MITNCLLIDDDVEDNFLFASALQEIAPSLVLEIEDSSVRALERLQQDDNYSPELIFLDLNMPVIDGKECLVELRKIERIKKVPIVIYSTSSYNKDITEVQQLGSTGYLVKPSGYKEIVAKLKEILVTLTGSNS
ncbi:response regulator [Telluribacter sp. SYSU D00476]|uniref:response regulator n=1 Tax=Telluribacter sp. SYSU D00476 TaxID=2811430 RepID=UPI001FF69892|nr:response regulator [Telluribacter sp. SYSU D00476]